MLADLDCDSSDLACHPKAHVLKVWPSGSHCWEVGEPPRKAISTLTMVVKPLKKPQPVYVNLSLLGHGLSSFPFSQAPICQPCCRKHSFFRKPHATCLAYQLLWCEFKG